MRELRVAFLGVFDTVAAMDGIHRHGERIETDVVFENGTLHPRIDRAVHVVALDEDRVAFEPTLINRDAEHPGRITEIWFPGVHGDVGGGYWHDGLADVALRYMLDRCAEHLGDDLSVAVAPTVAALRDLLAGQPELGNLLDPDDIVIHRSVAASLHAHTSGSGRMYPKETRRMCVWDGDRPLPNRDCRPLVHHAVKSRFDLVPDYRPAALRGARFALLLPDGGMAPIDGIAGLREHRDERARDEKRSG